MFHKTMAIFLTVTLITATLPTRLLAAGEAAPASPEAASETVRKVVGLGFIFGTLGTFPAIAVAFRNPKIGLVMLGISAGTAVLSGIYLWATDKSRSWAQSASAVDRRSEVLTAPAQPSASERQDPPVARAPSDIVDMDELRVTE